MAGIGTGHVVLKWLYFFSYLEKGIGMVFVEGISVVSQPWSKAFSPVFRACTLQGKEVFFLCGMGAGYVSTRGWQLALSYFDWKFAENEHSAIYLHSSCSFTFQRYTPFWLAKGRGILCNLQSGLEKLCIHVCRCWKSTFKSCNRDHFKSANLHRRLRLKLLR